MLYFVIGRCVSVKVGMVELAVGLVVGVVAVVVGVPAVAASVVVGHRGAHYLHELLVLDLRVVVRVVACAIVVGDSEARGD